jgi:hypothetical protein
MKKQLLLLTIITIVFVGCSSDSSASLPITEQNLVGKWYRKGAQLGTQPYEAYEHNCPASRDYQEMLDSHDMKHYSHGTDCAVNEITARFWTLDGNKLTVINPDPIVITDNVYTILKLTEEELILRIDNLTPTGMESDKYYWTRN